MNETSERERFIAALSKDENNLAVRMAFADWLDEHGEHEEADRHHRWSAAKAWLLKACEIDRPRPEDYNSSDSEREFYQYLQDTWINYDALIEMGHQVVKDAEKDRGYLGMGFGNNEYLRDEIWEHAEEFWRNWSIITGVRVQAGMAEKVQYSCAC